MKWKLILFLCFFPLQFISAQDQLKIDSLKIKLNNSKEDTTKIRLLLELSNCYSQTNLLEALAQAEKSLKISTKIGNKMLEVHSLLAIGNNLIFLGNYDQAMNKFLTSLKIAEENKFETEELISLSHLGIIQDRLQQFDKALDYYFKALNIYNNSNEQGKLHKDIKTIQSLYNNIGNIYSSSNDFNTAEKYYFKGLTLSEEKKDYINIGVICNNLGKLEIQRKNFEKAYSYLIKSLEARQKINDKSGVAKSYIFLGNYYQNINQPEKAIEFAKKAFDIGTEMQEMLTIKNSSMMLYENYEHLNQPVNALKYHILYMQASDSLINDNKIEEITRLQLQYDYDKQEKEIEIKQQQIRYTYIIVLSSLILAIIILGLLFILSRIRNKGIKLEKERLEEDMIIKNKELTTNVIYLMQKNELIDNITSRLLKLKGKLKDENKEPVQKIIYDLQSLTNNDAWNEFEMRFQNVHEQFYQNLQKKFPDLTPTEIKIAAFLRLNMTSKEVASITGQSINSVETARYRLRKKLGINNQEVNLVNFLLNI